MSRPDDIHPWVTTPVIESPSSPFIKPTITDADSDIDSVGLRSPDDLPPVSVAATSDSEGPTDADMDVDSTSDWGYEAASAPEIELADDNGLSDEYQEPEHDDKDNDEEDEQILYQEFLAQRHKTKKVSTDLQAESSSNVVLASDKTKPSKVKPTTKLAVRNSIADLRTVAPMAAVAAIKAKKHQVSDNEDEQAAKCPKAANVRGLVANWEKMYNCSEPAASTTSLATTNGVGDDTDDLSIQPTGEFSKDEDLRVVKAARQAKDGAVHGQVTNAKSKKAAGLDKKSIMVELKLADFEDLPLSTTADIKLFKQCFVVPILDWTATLKDQFSSNNHAELKLTVVELWNHMFSHLPKYLDEGKKELRVDHLAIMGVASDGHGSYLRPLIIQTMAYHVQRTFNIPRTFGPPAGALALAAAVALQVWKKGANSLAGKQSKNSPESFGEDPWASVVKQHFKNTQALSKDKWNEILLHCQEFSAGRKVDEDDGSSDSEEGEESEDVDLSG
ncbi:uncharacterized protein ARMOST_14259 [Armillaria ostoyae]|uniref:Uncharacterized protein n=1 Tax=Armillaria ostoyae TaxID=47428 RepID=A0A284RQ37_ARMOS|nr:uncharacterized protein ARMOST_14259 [Armillaria ostoyae]